MSYDSWKTASPYYEAEIEDEGIDWLKAAIARLKPIADADEDQVTPEFEAVNTMEDLLQKIKDEYNCRFCGEPTNERRTYCSAGCARADREGM